MTVINMVSCFTQVTSGIWEHSLKVDGYYGWTTTCKVGSIINLHAVLKLSN